MPSTIVYIFGHVLRYDWHSGHARKYFGFLYNLNLTVNGDYINGLSNTFHSRATPCSVPIPSFVLGIVVAFGCYDTNLRILCKLFCMEIIKNTSLPMISRFWVRNVRNIKLRLNTRTKEENHEDNQRFEQTEGRINIEYDFTGSKVRAFTQAADRPKRSTAHKPE